MTNCRYCAEALEQADTGRPREFCDDAERVAFNRRRASAPPGWDAEPINDGPMNQATAEAEQRFYAAHPERQAPPWLASLAR